MRATILTAGSRGDVQPYVALGAGLRAAGHEVRLATHGIFEPLARAHGLGFHAVAGNPEEMIQDELGHAWLESDRSPVRFVRGFRRIMGPVVHAATRDALAACQGADLIITSGVGFYMGYSIAEELGAPLLQAYLQPIHPTRAFPSAIFPTRYHGGPWFNLLTHVGGGQLFWQLMRPLMNTARREILGLAPFSVVGPFFDMQRRAMPVAYGYSPSVLPKPREWPAHIHVTGYWFLPDTEWAPPPELADFLAAGPPPVYVGFGSMGDRDPERTTAIVLDALRRAGRRGLLLTGWAGLAQGDLPDDVFKIEQAPHGWLFPRMAAVVHHGGAGTTAAGLRAGVPSVVVPFFADQPFWARRVLSLGVSPRPISRWSLAAGRLADAIRAAVIDEGMRRRAAALGARIRAEDGVGGAVALAEGAVGKNRAP